MDIYLWIAVVCGFFSSVAFSLLVLNILCRLSRLEDKAKKEPTCPKP